MLLKRLFGFEPDSGIYSMVFSDPKRLFLSSPPYFMKGLGGLESESGVCSTVFNEPKRLPFLVSGVEAGAPKSPSFGAVLA